MTGFGATGLEPMRRASWWRATSALGITSFFLAAFYLWTYGDCLERFFHFDDFWALGAASRIRIESFSDLVQFFEPIHGFLLYRPISTLLYFYAMGHTFGPDPFGYHATQMVFHIVNAVLVYAIADVLFVSRPLALASAIVYAAAPGHAIAVCWNALFTVTGTAFFYFFALWVWFRLDSRWRVPLAFLLFLAAILSSEHAISFPIVLTLASVLLGDSGWRRALKEQAPFYAVSLAYVGAKLYYLEYLFPATVPDAAVLAYYLDGYQIDLHPQPLVEHLGRYLGFAVNLIYRQTMGDECALVLGGLIVALAAVSTLCVLTGRWTARPLRVAAFGLDLFIVALGPVLVLPFHVFSYYVGIAGLGIALAITGFASRLSRWAPALIVVVILGTHFLSAAASVRRSGEFEFFNAFSRGAAKWLYTLAAHTQGQAIEEVVVPENQVTRLVFDLGDAHRLFLCAPYRVRTSRAIDDVESAPGRLILRGTDPFARIDSSGWIGRFCRRN